MLTRSTGPLRGHACVVRGTFAAGGPLGPALRGVQAPIATGAPCLARETDPSLEAVAGTATSLSYLRLRPEPAETATFTAVESAWAITGNGRQVVHGPLTSHGGAAPRPAQATTATKSRIPSSFWTRCGGSSSEPSASSTWLSRRRWAAQSRRHAGSARRSDLTPPLWGPRCSGSRAPPAQARAQCPRPSCMSGASKSLPLRCPPCSTRARRPRGRRGPVRFALTRGRLQARGTEDEGGGAAHRGQGGRAGASVPGRRAGSGMDGGLARTAVPSLLLSARAPRRRPW